MEKVCVELEFKDMCAIKYALEYRLTEKDYLLDIMEADSDKENKERNKDLIKKLKKDIEHESKLAEKFEEKIKNFKERNCIE